MYIFKCDCGGEAVLINWDDGFKDCPDSTGIEMAFWQVGHNYPAGWRYRFRQAWRILRTGRPYLDMLLLRPKIAENLAKKILKLISKHESING